MILLGLLAILAIFDIFLLGLILSQNKKMPNTEEIFKDLREERLAITSLSENFKNEMTYLQTESKKRLDKMSNLALEVEMDIKNFKEILSEDVDKVCTQLMTKVENSTTRMKEQMLAVEAMNQNADSQRQLLGRSLKRAESLVQFFQKEVPYEDILNDIRDKKYQDARVLLTEGIPISQVAKEIGLSENEIKLMEQFS